MPLVKLVLPLMAGIIVYLQTGFRLPGHAFIAIYSVLGPWLWFLLSFRGMGYSRRWLPGLVAMLLFVVLGFHLAHGHDEVFRQRHFGRHGGKEGFLLLRVSEPVAEKTNSYQVIGNVGHFLQGGVITPTRGKIMLYLEKDSLAANLSYGDLLLVENRYDPMEAPKNPRQFNYRKFLSHRNIHHSAYRKSGQWHFAGEGRGRWLTASALSLRQYALGVFSRHLPGGREYAVISALLLGYRDYLDEDLQREFAGAGAMHILCVSGLHVGIIYMVLRILTAFMVRFRGGQSMQTIAIVMIIWLYAAVTGFSPSVLRASAMFSFVAVGQNFSRRTNIFNTLAASAMLLMAIDPFIITRIGFQLSYLAVISIVTLQPPLYHLVRPRHTLTDKAWAIITVSAAAQLATGPLSLFYFNQFPNYFLITNLAVIPLSGLIIYSGLATLLFSSIPFVGQACGHILYILLMALHNIVRMIEGLPLSTTNHIYLTLPEIIFIFLMVICGMSYFMAGRRVAIPCGLLALLCLTTSIAGRKIQQAHQRHFIVYHINRGSLIDLICSRDRLTLLNEAMAGDHRSVGFNAGDYRLSRGVNSSTSGNIYLDSGGFLRFAGQSIFILTANTGNDALAAMLHGYNEGAASRGRTEGNGPGNASESPERTGGTGTTGASPDRTEGNGPGNASESPERTGGTVTTRASHDRAGNYGNTNASYDRAGNGEKPAITVDYIIVCQNPGTDPGYVLRVFKPGKVILDSSNRFRTVRLWKEACEKGGIPFWVVSEKGAYVGGSCSSFSPVISFRMALAALLLAPPPPSFMRNSW